MDRRAKIKEE